MDAIASDKPPQNDVIMETQLDERPPHRDNEFSEDVPVDFETNEADDAYRVQPGRQPNFR